MGVSIYNTAQRDALLNYAKSLGDAGLSADNAVEDPEFRSADFDHNSRNAYFVDTLGGPVLITILPGVVDTFSVYDTKKNFDVSAVTVLEPGGKSIVLNNKNRSWTVFYSGSDWYAVQTGLGNAKIFT